MVLPVGVGIDRRVAACIVAPFVDFALRETCSLTVGYETGVLNLHEVSIIGDEIQTLGDGLERDIAAVSDSRGAFGALTCGNENDTVGGT